jgi:hypothetical protein
VELNNQPKGVSHLLGASGIHVIEDARSITAEQFRSRTFGGIDFCDKSLVNDEVYHHMTPPFSKLQESVSSMFT